jgi:SAM-dependent methyltransferase
MALLEDKSFWFLQELTEALLDHFELSRDGDHILGVDVDKALIEVSNEKIKRPQITFLTCDMTKDDQVLNQFLNNHGKTSFDVVFCFSVSMWVHLNHGDEGLSKFFRTIHDVCRGILVLEPQPWKCYMTAKRRMVKLKQSEFQHFEQICEHRNEKLLPHIISLCKNAGFKWLSTLGETNWKRPIMVFERLS